jgi:hypothetical protein
MLGGEWSAVGGRQPAVSGEDGGRPSADRGQDAAIFERECSERGAVVGFETVGGQGRSAVGGRRTAVAMPLDSSDGGQKGGSLSYSIGSS